MFLYLLLLILCGLLINDHNSGFIATIIITTSLFIDSV